MEDKWAKQKYIFKNSFISNRKRIDNLHLNENIAFNNSMLEKIYAREGYTIDLIEQMWRELDMKDKLDNFKKNRFKDSKYVK